MPLLSTFAVGSLPGILGRGISASAAIVSYTVTRIFTQATTWVAPSGVTSVDYLLVAGGGGGGSFGGGGGAGGVLQGTGFSVTPGQSYTITIGGGGAAACSKI